MKRKTTITLIAALIAVNVFSQNPFYGYSNVFTSDSKPPVVSGVYPNGGESYYFGLEMPVSWNAMDDSFGANPISVYISLDGGLTYDLLAFDLSNDGIAQLMPPGGMNENVKIKVVATDEFGNTASIESSAVFSLIGNYLDVRVMLEGSFNGGEMSTFLNTLGLIPLDQPYTEMPYNYSGTESVASVPNGNIVDWVLVELRYASAPENAMPSEIIHRQAAFLLNTGEIVGLDGSSPLQFGLPVDQQLFAVVYHRNHLAVIGANACDLSGNTYSYNFTTSGNQVFGGQNAHKELSANVWGMFSGDADSDGDVHNGDKNDAWANQSGLSGYNTADMNLDGDVNNNDKIMYWSPNSGRSSQVPGL